VNRDHVIGGLPDPADESADLGERVAPIGVAAALKGPAVLALSPLRFDRPSGGPALALANDVVAPILDQPFPEPLHPGGDLGGHVLPTTIQIRPRMSFIGGKRSAGGALEQGMQFGRHPAFLGPQPAKLPQVGFIQPGPPWRRPRQGVAAFLAESVVGGDRSVAVNAFHRITGVIGKMCELRPPLLDISGGLSSGVRRGIFRNVRPAPCTPRSVMPGLPVASRGARSVRVPRRVAGRSRGGRRRQVGRTRRRAGRPGPPLPKLRVRMARPFRECLMTDLMTGRLR